MVIQKKTGFLSTRIPLPIKKIWFILKPVLLLIPYPFLQAVNVSNSTQLETQIINANNGTVFNIVFSNNIPYTQLFQPLNTSNTFAPLAQTFTIDGAGNSLSTTGSYRGFFARGTAPRSITIRNLTINGAHAKGGDGGGGGLGAGGGLYLNAGAQVTVENVTFTNCTAQGGNSSGRRGGGGLHGNGGLGGTFTTGGGGGGGGFSGNGGNFNGGGGGFKGNGGVGFEAIAGGGGGGGGGGFNGGIGGRGPSGGGGNNGGGGGGAGDGGHGSDGSVGSGGIGGTGSSGGAAGGAGASAGGIGGGGGGGSGGSGASNGNPGTAGTAALAGVGGSGSGGGGGGGTAPQNFNGGNGGNGGFGFGGGGAGSAGGNLGTGNGGNGGNGGEGGGGGGGGSAITLLGGSGGNGGHGNIFGGGGAGGDAHGNGGNGDFGGGGGSSGEGSGTGGSGGFGGGGGNGNIGGFGGGSNGGGGAAMGGAIFIENGAELTIIRAIAFSGNSVIGGTGTNNGTPYAPDIFMMSGGSIVVSNLTSNSIVPTPIASDLGAGGGGLGAGGLTLDATNSATLLLNGTNTYTGTTTVNGGALFLEGSVITPIIVTGGTLSGNPTLAVHPAVPSTGDLTFSGGSLRPGGLSPFGQVIVGNNFVFQNSSFSIDVDSVSNSDTLGISGTATLVGIGTTLNVEQAIGNFIQGEIIPIISAAGGLGGTFGTVNVPLAPSGNPLFQAIYTSNGMQLLVLESVIFHHLFTNQSVHSGNPQHVVDYILSILPNILPDTQLAHAVEVLGLLSTKELNKALNSLHPAPYGALEWINFNNNSLVSSIFSQHLFELSCSPRACRTHKVSDRKGNFWVQPFGIWNNQSSLGQLRGHTSNSAGVTTGYDHCFSHAYLGLGGGYTHTDFHWRPFGGKGEINQVYGGFYGSFFNSFIAADFSSMIGGNFYDIKRKIFYEAPDHPNAIVDKVAKNNYTGLQITSHFGLIGDLIQLSIPLQVFGNVDHFYLNQKNFHEHGASDLNLGVNAKISNMLRTELGLNLIHTFTFSGGCWAPYLRVSWVSKLPLSSSTYRAKFYDQGESFYVNTTSQGINQVAPGFGTKFTANNGLSFLFNSRAEVNAKFQNYFLDFRLDYSF